MCCFRVNSKITCSLFRGTHLFNLVLQCKNKWDIRENLLKEIPLKSLERRSVHVMKLTLTSSYDMNTLGQMSGSSLLLIRQFIKYPRLKLAWCFNFNLCPVFVDFEDVPKKYYLTSLSTSTCVIRMSLVIQSVELGLKVWKLFDSLSIMWRCNVLWSASVLFYLKTHCLYNITFCIIA